MSRCLGGESISNPTADGVSDVASNASKLRRMSASMASELGEVMKWDSHPVGRLVQTRRRYQ
jgi:hypothetical protein